MFRFARDFYFKTHSGIWYWLICGGSPYLPWVKFRETSLLWAEKGLTSEPCPRSKASNLGRSFSSPFHLISTVSGQVQEGQDLENVPMQDWAWAKGPLPALDNWTIPWSLGSDPKAPKALWDCLWRVSHVTEKRNAEIWSVVQMEV